GDRRLRRRTSGKASAFRACHLALTLCVPVWLWPSLGEAQRSDPVLVHRQEPTGWSSSGPVGAYVTAVAVDPTHPGDVYMATETAGIFKSSDKGSFWTLLRKPILGETVESLAIQPFTQTLYAGTSNGISRSLDGGATWTDPSTIKFNDM